MEKNKKVKHKPPSRIRYEKSHPTISFRLGIDLKTRLEKVLENESFGDFIKEALGEREREKKTLEEARNEGYGEGYEEGKKEFAVYGECVICGEVAIVPRKKIERFLKSEVLYHEGCREAQRERRV